MNNFFLISEMTSEAKLFKKFLLCLETWPSTLASSFLFVLTWNIIWIILQDSGSDLAHLISHARLRNKSVVVIHSAYVAIKV